MNVRYTAYALIATGVGCLVYELVPAGLALIAIGALIRWAAQKDSSSR